MLSGAAWAAYATLALLIGVECVGVPVPRESALIAAGALARDGSLNIVAFIVVAATAAILGGKVGYLVGRHCGRGLLSTPGPLHRPRLAVLSRGEPFFARLGAKAVFFDRWDAWARMGATLLAGTSRMPWPRFTRWNLLGGIAWASSVGLAAYLLSAVVDSLAATSRSRPGCSELSPWARSSCCVSSVPATRVLRWPRR